MRKSGKGNAGGATPPVTGGESGAEEKLRRFDEREKAEKERNRETERESKFSIELEMVRERE